MKRLLPVTPAVRPAATPPSGDETAPGSGSGVLPLLKNDGESGVRGANSAGPPANPNGPASFDNVPSAGPAASASPGADARNPPAESPPQPQAPDAGRDRTESLQAKPAPIAAPAFSATGEAPASEAVKAPAEPEPNKATGSAQRRGPETQPTQPGDPSGATKHKATAVGLSQTPPIWPAPPEKPRKRERTAKPHKAAQAEAVPKPSPPSSPAEPEAPAAGPTGNPLLRALGDALK